VIAAGVRRLWSAHFRPAHGVTNSSDLSMPLRLGRPPRKLTFPIEDGAVVLRMDCDPGLDITVHTGIAFGEGGQVKGEWVVDTLVAMTDLVSRTVDQFRTSPL
jgi:hypothetical protein